MANPTTISDPPGYTFSFYQFRTFDSLIFAYKYAADKAPIPLTGYSSRMTLKSRKNGDLIVMDSNTVSGSRMIQDDDAGTMQPYIVPDDAKTPGDYDFDLIIYTDSATFELQTGVARMLPTVSRVP